MSRSKKQPSSQPVPLTILAEKFYQWLQVRNFAASTIKLRREYLGQFLQWLDDRGITRIDEITREVLLGYQRYLFHHRSRRTGKPLKFSTQISRLIPVRAWFRFLLRERIIAANPASDMDLPKEEQRLPSHVLSADRVERIMNQPDVSSPFGLRDRAMLETLYSTAMRRSELIHLTVYDLDAERGIITIRQGKGGKDRNVPVGQRALAWIAKYQQEVRPVFAERTGSNVIFLSRNGKPFGPSNLSILVRGYIKSSGVTAPGSCHLFRHAAVTLMLENGADLRSLQTLLGHADLTTTQIYTHISIKHLQDVHRATHPADLPQPEEVPPSEELPSSDDVLQPDEMKDTDSTSEEGESA